MFNPNLTMTMERQASSPKHTVPEETEGEKNDAEGQEGEVHAPAEG